MVTHSFLDALFKTNNNYTAVDIDEKQGGQYHWSFFPTVES